MNYMERKKGGEVSDKELAELIKKEFAEYVDDRDYTGTNKKIRLMCGDAFARTIMYEIDKNRIKKKR